MDAWGYAVAWALVNWLVLWAFTRIKHRHGAGEEKAGPGAD